MTTPTPTEVTRPGRSALGPTAVGTPTEVGVSPVASDLAPAGVTTAQQHPSGAASVNDIARGAASAGERTGALAGRRALITGGASGLGEAMAQAFTEAGASVTVADVNAEAAAAVADRLGADSWAVDLADTEAFDGQRIDADILVNNAGIQRIHPLTEFPLAEWQLINRLMLEAPFVLTKAVLPGMYERGWGRIINLSSVHGLRASANKSAYVAAKHGIMGLTKTTALEAGPHGVTCNAINPGYVLTPLVKGQIADQARTNGIGEDEVLEQVFLGHSAVPRLAEPAEVAALALFLAGDAAAVINGSAHSMDGGWSAA